jgi:hypothetical protein
MPPTASRKQRRRKGKSKTAESLPGTIPDSSKVTVPSLDPSGPEIHKGIPQKDATAPVDVPTYEEIYYVILSFLEGEGPDQVNSDHTADRRMLVEEYGDDLLAAVKGWTVGKEPDSDLVHSWWCMEIVAECERAITPEGRALSLRLREQAQKCMKPKQYSDWERLHNKSRAEALRGLSKKLEEDRVLTQGRSHSSTSQFSSCSAGEKSIQKKDTEGKTHPDSVLERSTAPPSSKDNNYNQSKARKLHERQVQLLANQLVEEDQERSGSGIERDTTCADSNSHVGEGTTRSQMDGGKNHSRVNHSYHWMLTISIICLWDAPYYLEAADRHEKGSFDNEQISIKLVEHVSLQLLSRHKVSLGSLLDYHTRQQQETPVGQNLRQATAWQNLRNIMDLVIPEAHLGGFPLACVEAWWRTEVVVELWENGVSQFAQHRRQGLNSELQVILGSAETEYKSHFVDRHFTVTDESSRHSGLSSAQTSAQKTRLTAKDDLTSVFKELSLQSDDTSVLGTNARRAGPPHAVSWRSQPV